MTEFTPTLVPFILHRPHEGEHHPILPHKKDLGFTELHPGVNDLLLSQIGTSFLSVNFASV